MEIETRDPEDPDLDFTPDFDAEETPNRARGRVFNLGRRWAKRAIRQARAVYFRRQFGSHHNTDLELLTERHHNIYGMPWAIGREQFDFMCARGLAPNHDVVDLGCGSLRLGIWLIGYLDSGRYRGIDNHLKSLQAGAYYEIPLHGLMDKRARLLHDAQFSLDYFRCEFDWVVCLSVLKHLRDEQVHHALAKSSSSLKLDGRLVVNHSLPVPDQVIAEQYGLELCFQGAYPCTILARGTGWREYVLRRRVSR